MTNTPNTTTQPTTMQLLQQILDTPGAFERLTFEQREQLVDGVSRAADAARVTHPPRNGRGQNYFVSVGGVEMGRA